MLPAISARPSSPSSLSASVREPEPTVVRRALTTASLPTRLAPDSAATQRYTPLSILRMPVPARIVPQRDGAVELVRISPEIVSLQNLPAEGAWGRSAHFVSNSMGTPYAFFTAVSSVVVWLAVGGPMQWDNTWLMIMSTGASIMAFLMVFVVQTSANRSERELRFRVDQIERRTMQMQQDLAAVRLELAEFMDVAARLREELGRD